MTVIISDDKVSHEYYNVPSKVAKALLALLDECGNDETEIIVAESDPEK